MMHDIPWHAKQWQHIQQMLLQDRLPHALLFEGRQGLGKNLFATQLAQLMLCKDKTVDGTICQSCASCQWFKNDSHPDYLHLQPEEGKKSISVESIRSAIKKIVQTSHQSGYRVLLIEPADAMTIEAANSLLKTLEEPPPQTLLMLLTDKPIRLLPTIRSRATRLKFVEPESEVAVDWMQGHGLKESAALQLLALSHGAPLRFSIDSRDSEELLMAAQSWWASWLALQNQSLSALQLAKEWKTAEPRLLLNWLEGLLKALITQETVAIQDIAILSLYPGLQEHIGKISFIKLFALRDRVLNLMQKLHTSLNWGLQLESLAIECQALSR